MSSQETNERGRSSGRNNFVRRRRNRTPTPTDITSKIATWLLEKGMVPGIHFDEKPKDIDVTAPLVQQTSREDKRDAEVLSRVKH
jgi:hypothetical protein